MSPEEGSTIDAERRAKSGFPKPTKRIKSCREFGFIGVEILTSNNVDF